MAAAVGVGRGVGRSAHRATASFPGPRQVGDLALHERRSQPGRHVGPQAGAHQERRERAARLRQEHGVLHRIGRAVDEVAVRLGAPWPERHLGEQPVPPPRAPCGQDGLPPLLPHRVEQPQPRAVHGEHGLDPDGFPLRGIVGDLWARQREPRPAVVRRDERSARPRIAQGPCEQLGRGLPAQRLPGHMAPAQGRAHRQSPTDRRDGGRRAARATRSARAPQPRPPRAFAARRRVRRTHPELRARLPDADRRARGLRHRTRTGAGPAALRPRPTALQTRRRAVPDGPPHGRTRRAVRADLLRRHG